VLDQRVVDDGYVWHFQVPRRPVSTASSFETPLRGSSG
jgi:hypothetical protein